MTTPPLPRRPAAAFWSSAATTARLVRRRQLAHPRTHVGKHLYFRDGTQSEVYRETVLLGVDTIEPATLVVQFRLRFVGRSRGLHAAFRVESMANTPLFAGFPGFRTKLWATDLDTGVYRGVYDWDGAHRARYYADTLGQLLRRVCEPGTVRCHVQQGIRRDAYLRRPEHVSGASAVDGWWLLREEFAP